MSVCISMVWIGQPVPYISREGLPLTLEELLTTELLNLDVVRYPLLPMDIGGFLSFLETAMTIKSKSVNVELFFHCYKKYIPYYKNVFHIFCRNFTLRKPNKKTRPKYKIISIEDSVKKMRAVDTNLFLCLNAYLKFIQDSRVRNLRHYVNFKDLFYYVVLYLYGGYVFDTNVFAMKNTQQLSKPCRAYIEEFRRIHNMTTNPQNLLKLLCEVPLSKMEITIILGPIQKPARSLAIFLQMNPFSKAWCLFQANNQIQTSAIRLNSHFDIYALRARAKQNELLEILRFSLKNVILIADSLVSCGKYCTQPEITMGTTELSVRQQNMRHILTWYYLCGMNCGCLSSLFEHICDYVSNHSLPNEMNIIPQKDLSNILCSTFVPLDIADTYGQIFINFPLIKFHKGSHFVKNKYIDTTLMEQECQAIVKHLNSVCKIATQLSRINIDIEKLFVHYAKQTLNAS